MSAEQNLCGRTGTDNSMKTKIMIWSVEETLKEKERLVTLDMFMEPNS